MKTKLLTLGLVLASGFTIAQTNAEETSNVKTTVNELGQTVLSIQPSSFQKVYPFGNWSEEDSKSGEAGGRERIMDIEGYLETENKPTEVDPVIQSEMGTRGLKAPIVNFNGMTSTAGVYDPSGAAGPDHYVQAINTSVRIYTKTGSIVPGGTFSLSTLWPGSSNMGDPIVMYDRHADRWFISQFNQSPNRMLIAVSETPDPTGAYYAYSYTFASFPDYPKFSIWWDAYYMCSNSQHTAVAYDRTKMLAGDPTAGMVSLSLPALATGGFTMPLPADSDGDLPPNGTPCYFFNLEDDQFSGASVDAIQIYEMTTDWVTPGNSSVTASQQLAVPSFDSMFSGGWNNIAQPGTSQALDAIMGGLMYRAQHMRWTSYNSIVLSHAVDLGANKSGIRWYELRDANDGVWSVYQSSTYAPDNVSRWMSSIAMDNWGNIGMGYSISDAVSVYPGLAYTGRLWQDALGDMSYGEQIAMTGSSSQTGGNRYGDYSQLSLDPDGETFWYTGEYMGASGAKKTRIFSFNLRAEAGIEDQNPYYTDLTMVAYQTGSEITVKMDGIFGSEEVELNLIGMNGQAVYASKNVKPVNGGLDKQIDVSKLETGVYFVQVGNPNFQTVERILIKN